ncbi:MAG: hypothetical protein IPK16_05375 [Anaerolineales bacterium]|nr:hypothetical protein [Anaerolineales bacterium]
MLITTAALRPALEPLLGLRKAQGLRAILVDVQAIYDEFSGGATDPAAIHAFLQYAYTHWRRPAPTYVLLAGDGSFDPLGYCTEPGVCFDGLVTPPETNQIPPFLVASDPWIGETAADNRYVTFSAEGGLPAMAIGRLPVATLAEARAVVAKILDYERQPAAQEWRAHITFVTDNAFDAGGELDPAGNFWDFSDRVANDPMLAAAGLRVERLYLNLCDPDAHGACRLPNPPYPPLKDGPSLTSALIGAINAGSAIVNYTGHAALASWAGLPEIFSSEDATRLINQDRLPVMVDMTCYTGYFHFPGAPSLAETLLRAPTRGSVAGVGGDRARSGRKARCPRS